MTNQEKLREVFPKTIFIYRKENDKTVGFVCSEEWLESEYIEPQADDKLSEAYEKLKVGHEVLEMEYEEALNEIQRLRDAAQDAKNEINNTVKVREGCALGNGISVGLKMAAGIIDKYMRSESK